MAATPGMKENLQSALDQLVTVHLLTGSRLTGVIGETGDDNAMHLEIYRINRTVDIPYESIVAIEWHH